ncbi:unnamed protein product [Rhizophagus irregularis]|uniref:Zinc finger bed domain-containing protein 1-like n=1 Tax=Rhizophagus irregularis TaxID=588596 RepID=A0A915YQB2_9GLOM|nr:unnamed protein product [Rhizophagus irregularis]
MSHEGTSKNKGKRSIEAFNNAEFVPDESDETVEEQDELDDTEFFQPPTKKQCLNKNNSKEKRRAKATAKVRQKVNQEYQEEGGDNGNNDTNINIRSGIITITSGIPENEVPKGSFVWECGVYYKDGSTTTNLINHLVRVHKVFKPTERKIITEGSLNQSDIRVAIKNQRLKVDGEYEESRQLLVEFILDNNQAFNILNCKSFRHLLYSLDKNFAIPCDKTVKTMINNAYTWSSEQLTELLRSDCIAASITTDFWTSRAKHGYIAVTCSWVSMDWKLKEALLILQQVPYPHTEIKPNNEPPLSIENEEELDEVDLTTILENIETIIGDAEDLIDVSELDKVKRKVNISTPLNLKTDDYLNKVKQTMYESMAKYWKTSATIAMIACVLDPRFKKLRFITDIIKRKIYKEFYDIFEKEKEVLEFENELKDADKPFLPLPSQSTSAGSSREIGTIIVDEDNDDYNYEQRKKSILDDIYAKPNEPDENENELDTYLSLDEEGRDTDPFDWWKQRQSRFPVLARLAHVVFLNNKLKFMPIKSKILTMKKVSVRACIKNTTDRFY